MSVALPPEDQLARLLRGAVDCIRAEDLLERLKRGKPLTVKAGFDPSSPDIHLGHTVVLRKMRQFQELGHRVVVVVGDFTAMIGDPSGRSKTRPALTREQVQANAETYKRQAMKVLDPDKTELAFNSSWLDKLGSEGFVRLASRYTVARMIERDDFTKRFKAGLPIAIHEFLYPLAQAYDSVALKADVELGGTDQTFNLLVGRDIMREYGLEAQIVMTLPLLVGLDGSEKMSKSLDNYVAIEDEPANMYGKLMSVSDALMWSYWELLTELEPLDVKALKEGVARGERHPMTTKQELAWRITADYHGQAAADAAREEFGRVFKSRERPTEVEERVFPAAATMALTALIADAGLAASRSEAKRLIEQGGVTVDDKKLTDPRAELDATVGRRYELKIGKRRFLVARFE